MISRMWKAITAAIASGAGTVVFAAVSDGKIDGTELSAIAGIVAGVFGLTWLVPNTPPDPSPLARNQPSTPI